MCRNKFKNSILLQTFKLKLKKVRWRVHLLLHYAGFNLITMSKHAVFLWEMFATNYLIKRSSRLAITSRKVLCAIKPDNFIFRVYSIL